MKKFIQQILFGYRENPTAFYPAYGAKLAHKGGTATEIHNALTKLQKEVKDAHRSN